jgi:hypothetical protein
MLNAASARKPRAPARQARLPKSARGEASAAQRANADIRQLKLDTAAALKSEIRAANAGASRPSGSRGLQLEPVVGNGAAAVRAPDYAPGSAATLHGNQGAPAKEARPPTLAKALGKLGESFAGQMRGLSDKQAGLAASVLLPFVQGPFRAAPPLACKETAVAMTWDVLPANFPTLGVGSQPWTWLPEGDLFVIVLREAGTFAIVYDPNAGAALWEYNLVLENISQITEGLEQTGAEPVPIIFHEANSAETYSPHGSTTYTRQNLDGIPSMWVDCGGTGAQTAFVLENMGVGAGTFYCLASGECNGIITDSILISTISSGSCYFLLPTRESGYYNFAIVQETATTTPTGLAAYISGTCAVCGHLAAPDWAEFDDSVDTISVNAMSVMFTNTSAQLYRQGKRVQLQVPAGVDWPQLISQNGNWVGAPAGQLWAPIAEIPGAVAEDVVEGAYSAAKPESITCYLRKPVALNAEGQALPPTVGTAPANDYLLMYISTAAGQVANQDGFFSLTCSTEFETRDQTRERRLPDHGTLEFQDTHDKIARMAQHHTNDNHLPDLLGSISGALTNPVGTLLSQGLKWLMS